MENKNLLVVLGWMAGCLIWIASLLSLVDMTSYSFLVAYIVFMAVEAVPHLWINRVIKRTVFINESLILGIWVVAQVIITIAALCLFVSVYFIQLSMMELVVISIAIVIVEVLRVLNMVHLISLRKQADERKLL